MSGTNISSELLDKVIDFHGHWCPGLATGIRAAEWAVKELGKAADEEIVAVVETDMCGVDAIQYLTGCTFGKGNLIHQDYGKKSLYLLSPPGRQSGSPGGPSGVQPGGEPGHGAAS